MTACRFGVLGPLEVHRGDVRLALGGPKQRTVLAALLLEAGRVVSAERLAALVWGEAPDHAPATLQVYVSNLRRVLRDPTGSAAEVLDSRSPGYLITVPDDALDLRQVALLVAEAHRHRADGNGAVAANLLRLALGLWRGPTLADLRGVPRIAALATTIDRQHNAIRRELFALELELGRHLQLLAELDGAIAQEPHDEALVGLLMLALYRSGRQGDALAVYRTAVDRLVSDLGVDPGAELRTLESAVLRQDPVLDRGILDVPTTVQREDRGVRGACLVLANGVELELASRTWVIGRHPSCEVVLADPESSRRHAEIRPVRSGYLLVDLGSTNGTRIGSVEVREVLLQPGDGIVIGSTHMQYRAGVDGGHQCDRAAGS